MQQMVPIDRTYTIEALVAEGFSRHMIRKYVTWGVLPRAIGRGPSAHYTGIHIAILREIRRAKDDRRTAIDLADWARMRYPHAFGKT